MNPYKLKNVFEYLTSNNQLLKKKLKLGTSEIPIPPKRSDVTTIEAINRFNKANPRVDTTSLKPLSVKHSNIKQSNVNEPNEGAIQSAFDTATRDAQFEGYPAPNYEKFKSRYLKKNMKAEGGRIGYKDGPKFDVQASGTKSGKQQIQGAPDGITSDKETINAILTMDIPLTEKVNLIGDLQYGKFRDRIEYNDDEIFLDDPKSYRDRNIGLDYNRDGEGFSGSATVGDRGPAFNIRYKKSFADGGMLVQPSDDGSRPGYKGTPLTGDEKLIKEWEKTLTDAVKKKDMTKTIGFKTFLDNKFKDKTKVDTIRNRILNKLNYKAKNRYSEIQENFARSLIKDHNNADKILYNRGEIFRRAKIDDASVLGQSLLEIMNDPKIGMEDINTKINKAFNKIVNGEVVLKKPKNITSVLKNYSLIPQMIGDISGVRNVENIKSALQFNSNFKDKNFVQVFNYLNKSGLAKDFIGSNFDEVFEYAKFRQGGLDVKGLLSYTTRYQNPESNILNFAVRHANRHFRDGTSEESLVKFYKKRANGTKGAPINFENLPRNRDGNRILNLNEVGFEYENQFFHKENLKTKGFKSGLFQEVYDLSGKNRLKVPDPNNPSKKITLQQLLKMTGDKLTIGHDEAFGGVKGKPFNGLQLQGGKLNTALFNAYDKIQNKQLRKLILNELQLVVPKEINYETAFINKSIEDAKNIVNNTSDTLYRQAGKNVITNLGEDFFKKSKPFQKETLRVAGLTNEKKANILSAFCNRKGFKLAGSVEGLTCSMEEIQTNMQKQIDEAAKVSKDGKIPKKFGKLKAFAGSFFGDVAIPLEYMFAAPYLAAGDIEGAKRATTAGLFGYGKVDLDKLPEGEGQRFLKHINALNSFMDNYQSKAMAENELENASDDESRFILTNRISEAAKNMKDISLDYQTYGYDGQKGLLQGKVATQQLIRDQVQSDYDKKINKSLNTEFFKDSDKELLESNIRYGDKENNPNQVTPITDLESYIRNKGEATAGNTNLFFDVKPYTLNRAEAYGVPDIFDQYAGGYAGVETPGFIRDTGEVDMGTKSVMDAYSSLPIEYASQLAALEKKQFEEGMLKKDIEQKITSSDPLQLASGGIASLTKTIPPESGPTPQGLPYVYNNVKKI